MSMFGFLMILLGTGSVTASLMELFDRLDRPRTRRRTV